MTGRPMHRATEGDFETMETEAQRYPLSWPAAWKRAPNRKPARFFSADRYAGYSSYHKSGKLTVAQAIERLEKQLDRLGGTAAILSTNIMLGLRGMPVSSRGEPQDPGAAVYFQLKGKPRVLACDTWDRVADNIAAIAAHIDAMRRIERYGVGNLEQAFAGYDALPAPSADNRAPWRGMLGFKADATVSVDDVQVAYRAHAKQAGNDQGALLQLNLARDAALRELGG